jgi:hypothetical protein
MSMVIKDGSQFISGKYQTSVLFTLKTQDLTIYTVEIQYIDTKTNTKQITLSTDKRMPIWEL